METIRFVERFIVYIEDHLREDIDFSEVLENMGVEQKSFLTIFTSLIGMTPAQYQEKRCMTEIAYEVFQGHRRLVDIIKYYGYRDVDQFKKIYSRTFGISVHETERNIKKMDLLDFISFEVVPTKQPKYKSQRAFIKCFRIIGIAQYFDINSYHSSYKYKFLKILERDGLIDEILRYNDGFVKGIFVQERVVDNEIEIFVGTASNQQTPFDETFTESMYYQIFDTSGAPDSAIDQVYEYIFRRWHFREEVNLTCDFSLELIKHTYSLDDADTKIQVWQALDE